MNLAPGESVHHIYSWKTSPVDPAKKCLSPAEMSWRFNYEWDSFRLSSPSLLKPICSPVTTTDYDAGQFLSDDIAEMVWPARGWRAPVIHWANDEDASYAAEHIPLRVTVDDPDHILQRDERSCPRLFLRLRAANPSRPIASRVTRVDEMLNAACKEEPSGALTMEFDAADFVKQSDAGEYTLDVSSLAEPEGHYLLVGTTDKLHLSLVDGKFIQRKWGERVDGAAVSLTLDSDVYDVGNMVPVHIAAENFDSQHVIAAREGASKLNDITVELQTARGLEVINFPWIDRGCRRYLMPGLLFPVEQTLGSLPPGIYKAVAVWKPSRIDNCGDGLPADYFTVRSRPVVFRVIEPRHPGPLGEPISTVTK